MAPQIPGARKLQTPRMKAFQKVDRYHFAVGYHVSKVMLHMLALLTLAYRFQRAMLAWTFQRLG